MKKWVFDNKIALILFGHDHKCMIEPILFDADKYFDFILIQAGSATSTRRRGSTNNFNLITFDNSVMQISVQTYIGNKFETSLNQKYIKRTIGWEKIE